MDTHITQTPPDPAPTAPVVPAELEPITWMCSGSVRYFDEGGRRYIYMHGLRFYVGQTSQEMDALLAMNWPNPAYPTRLFLPANLGHGLNWHETAYILGRSWVTWSWKDVRANQAPVAILADHLAAFR
jgi:hypothetical protein